ncbi:hypothetical protein A3728_04940 [Sulfitobacter sp. HI0040]|nr:hypothetical protein A3721_02345 [Sulfitobacter sp. HI0023]KZY24614.1 hypothetical protein A3728_04940 [Sulfitobacter sp. HI0040]KZZ67942.1 hypothetical protein A3764_13955 [Sulfitobacter sp. HI0129]
MASERYTLVPHAASLRHFNQVARIWITGRHRDAGSASFFPASPTKPQKKEVRMKDIEKRSQELREERTNLSKELDDARELAPQAIIEGRQPPPTASLAERLANLDAAISTLDARLADASEARDRARRTRQVQSGLEATSERQKLAAAVDSALSALAKNWSAYREAVRHGVGSTAAAGGDVAPIDRVLTNNRQSEALIKALIAAGNQELVRSLGIDTPIKARHAITLEDAESRVSHSLNVELARIKAASPQRGIAMQAQKDLEDY